MDFDDDEDDDDYEDEEDDDYDEDDKEKYLERFKGIKFEGVVQDLRGHVPPSSHPESNDDFDISLWVFNCLCID